MQPKKIQFSAEKFQFSAKKFQFSAKNVQFSANKIIFSPNINSVYCQKKSKLKEKKLVPKNSKQCRKF